MGDCRSLKVFFRRARNEKLKVLNEKIVSLQRSVNFETFKGFFVRFGSNYFYCLETFLLLSQGCGRILVVCHKVNLKGVED
jgi:hypothetical protein